jgi:hypothetical protein
MAPDGKRKKNRITQMTGRKFAVCPGKYAE